MNKIVLGILLGGILGAIDGATAWFTPEARSQMLGIIIGSTLKGVIAGLAAGWFARRVHSVPMGIIFGLAVGALLAYGIVLANGGKYVLAIMLPGSCVGAIVGWATQRYGRSSSGAASVTTLSSVLLLVAVAARAAAPITASAFDSVANRTTSASLDPDSRLQLIHAQDFARARQSARAGTARHDDADQVRDSSQRP